MHLPGDDLEVIEVLSLSPAASADAVGDPDRGVLAVPAETPARWVAGGEVHGNDPALRQLQCERGIGHVLAVSRDHQIRTHAGTHRAIELAVTRPASA